MSKKVKKPIIGGGCSDHPAFLAWKQINPLSATPDSIEILKEKGGKSLVYRLCSVIGAGKSIIVKCRSIGNLSVEAQLYTDILPKLSLNMVKCYGYIENYNNNSWLFLEDAGNHRYAPNNPEHWPLAIKWLANLHATSTEIVSTLRNTGPAYFLSVLREARLGVNLCITHPEIRDTSINAFKQLIDHLNLIEDEWDCIEEVCDGIPQTLVHGDFVPKNMRITGSGKNTHLLVVDWETAGTAPPAADIFMIPGGRSELRAYHEQLKMVWPAISWCDILRLYHIGEIFRLLHMVEWQTHRFKYKWIERAEGNMLIFQHDIQELIHKGIRFNDWENRKE